MQNKNAERVIAHRSFGRRENRINRQAKKFHSGMFRVSYQNSIRAHNHALVLEKCEINHTTI